MILPIVKEPNRTLRKKAREVDVKNILSEEIQALIRDMKETLAKTPDGVGLAAPQVNESLRIFIVSEEAEEIDKAVKKGYTRRKKDEEEIQEKPYEMREWRYYVFINPRVLNTARRKLGDSEGCLSVPGKYGTVKRHEKITVSAYDDRGKKFTRGASLFFARVMQHELDHLEGALFIDKAEKLLLRKHDGA